MSIVEIPRETWSGKVREVTLGAGPGESGTRTSTVTVSGETTLPFLAFGGADPHPPVLEPKLYAIGTPGPGSPLLITTNFSLTYFSVSGEIEGSGRSAWPLVADADGQSLLTGWAAGKFMVGPPDAVDIPSFPKNVWSA
jgi:hypothetical protein